MRIKYLILSLLLVGIVFISLVYAQGTGEGGGPTPVPSNAGGEGGGVGNYTANYDPEILDYLNNQTWVEVLVRLKDNSNITVTGTKEERRVLSRQRDEWFKPVIDEVLATLPDTEIKNIRKRSNGFSGEISKEGFDKLVKNPAIREIIKTLETGAHITNNVSISKNISKVEREPESEREIVETKEKGLLWLWATIVTILIILTLYLIIKIKKR